MKIKMSKRSCDPGRRQIIKTVGVCAKRLGISAYLVGGVVRDFLLGRRVMDLDFVVEGNGRRLADVLAAEFKGAVTYYPDFLTATVKLSDGMRIDVASSRREKYPRPGVLPVVEPGNLNEDLQRRDFTINALAVRVLPDGLGELTDLFGGRLDLRHRRIRILHDRSFLDDPTRILRAVRFEQRFGFRIEPKTLRLLNSALKAGVVDTVTPNRYFIELRKTLKESDPVKPLARLNRLKVLNFLVKGSRSDLRAVNKVHRSIKQLKQRKEYRNLDWHFVYFLALVLGYPSGGRERMNSVLSLTREEKRAVGQLAEVLRLVKQLQRSGMPASEVYHFLKPLESLSVLLLLALGSSTVKKRVERFFWQDRHAGLDIDGRDMAALGLSEGPVVGRILDRILSGKLDGKFLSRADQLQAAKKELKAYQSGSEVS
jgi:tRNA nucleotidyltransferase (CCA-adding enzyme)